MAKKQRRFCFDPSNRSYSGNATTVYVKGGKAVRRSSQVKAVFQRGNNFTQWKYIGHKPAQSKYLPSECFARGNR